MKEFTVQVRLAKEDYEKIKKESEKRGLSISAYLRMIFKNHLNGDEK